VRARFAVTTRRGGVSSGPFAEANLGGHVGDDPAAVQDNRRRVARRLGLDPGRVLYMNQVHGRDVATVDRPWGQDPPAVDALVTSTPMLGLAVLVADCTPLLLADSVAGLVSAVHVGRAGLLAGVVDVALEQMAARGAKPGDIDARIGPAVCGECYEVPAALQREVTDSVPGARSSTRQGTPGLDIRAGVRTQLRAAGVTQVAVDPACTMESAEHFSYRRYRVTGRFAGVVWLEP
jgi:purine-nucleoside/S-methyl-5'-thioadenosine phosphorylase / adenosine deaminase